MIDATGLLRWRARQRAKDWAAMDPAPAQESQLLALIARARDTAFGRAHGFSDIASVEQFQARVPLRRYEEFRRDYWQHPFPLLEDVTWPGRIPYFALSSGTTSDLQKYIPVSRAMLRRNARAGLDLLCLHLLARPQSRLLGGRNFMLGGSTDLVRLAPGVHAGDLSGIAATEIPWWARARTFPPRDLALNPDWDRKTALLAQAADGQDIRMIGGTPSWMLLFFERLAERQPGRPRRLASHWPQLELVVHGGVAYPPYAPSFASWLEGSHAELREVYAASEGFIAIADRGPGEGLRLLLDNGLFYEFVRLEDLGQPAPHRAWIGDAEEGVNYALVLSSCAGLWAYLIGDTVRLVGHDPPRLLVTGRTALSLSAFGEHLILEEIEQGMAEAAAAIGAALVDYTIGPVFSTPGHHLIVAEFSDAAAAAAQAGRFLQRLDASLSARNADYRDHRRGEFGMGPPRLVVAPRGGFAGWMKSRGRLGGQNKVPRVITDPDALQQLVRFLCSQASA